MKKVFQSLPLPSFNDPLPSINFRFHIPRNEVAWQQRMREEHERWKRQIMDM